MDLTALLVAIGCGAAIGGILASLLAGSRHAAVTSTLQAQLKEAQVARGALQDEITSLRARHEQTLAAESAASANVVGLQARVAALEASVADERGKAEAALKAQAGALQDLSALKTRVAEREKSLSDLQATVEQSRIHLTDAFKATGADVLKQAAESLLKQAKVQYEGQKQLSQQELEARQKAIESLVTPLKEQLLKQEQLVKELGEKREGDTHRLGEQLKQIAELQQKASTAALTLSSAMRDNRQRGQWGEITLRNVVEMAGLGAHVDFTEQSSVQSADGERLRPDMIVRLPGGRSIPIDAKVPMNAYLDSLDSNLADVERSRRRDDHAAAVRCHVRTLSSRNYAAAVEGEIEFTVMFVPVESALVTALESNGTLFKEALENRVIITTPSTLLALMRTCAMQWQQAKLNANALKIGECAKELLVRIENVAENLQKVGKGLEGATKAFNEAVGSYNRRLVPKARETAELAGELDAEPAEIELQSRIVRTDVGATLPPAGQPAAV